MGSHDNTNYNRKRTAAQIERTRKQVADARRRHGQQSVTLADRLTDLYAARFTGRTLNQARHMGDFV